VNQNIYVLFSFVDVDMLEGYYFSLLIDYVFSFELFLFEIR